MDAPSVQYVTTSDGYDIAYTVCGEGRPLILGPGPVHSLGWMWRRPYSRQVLEQLAARFTLVQYDGRGQGLSMRGLRDNLSLGDWELDLEAVADRLGLAHFILVHGGSSAYPSVSYTVKHPDRVDALVLENMPLERRSTVPLALDELAQQKWELFLEATARLSFPWEEHSTATDMVRETWNPADWSLKARVWQDWSVEGWLRELKVPTLVMASNLGTIGVVGGEEIRRTAALIPGARLIGLGESEGGIYMLKGAALRSSIADVDTAIGPQLVEEFLRDIELQSGEDEGPPAAPGVQVLSAREIEVLRLLATGRSNAQIADELVISLNTVNRHVSNIYAKTGAANRAEATGYAHRHGLAT